MNRSSCPALALSAFIFAVGLQTAAAQEPDAPPAPANCTKPDGPMPVKAPKAEVARFQKSIDEYKACVNGYQVANITKAKELQAQAQTMQSQAQAMQVQAQATQARAQTYATAANGAIDDFNAYVNNLNAQSQEAQKK